MVGGDRPFDDGRWPDLAGFAECFLCGRWVDPLDPRRGTFAEVPAGPELPIHLPCLDGREMPTVNALYHRSLTTMAEHARPSAN